MTTSPDVSNYGILKGIIKFTPTGGVQRDLGNAPEVELTPETEKLDHFSSRTGVRSKDRSVVLEKSMVLRVVLDELTADNIAMLLLGTVADVTDGTKHFEIFTESEIEGQIDFTGTNDVGNKIDMVLPNVSFGPSGSFNLVSDEFGQIELSGEVTVSDEATGSFGTVTVTDAA